MDKLFTKDKAQEGASASMMEEHLGETCDDHPPSNPRVEGKGILRYFNPGAGVRQMQLDFSSAEMRDKVTATHEVTLVDARKGPTGGGGPGGGGLDGWKFEENGFCFIRSPERPQDFFNAKQVRAEYAPQVLEEVKRVTGAKRAFWLNHIARTENFPKPDGGLALPYARFAHSDYGPTCVGGLGLVGHGVRGFVPSTQAVPTIAEARRILREVYKVPEEEASSCGVCVMGLWTPTDWPAYKDPLCLLDCSTIRADLEDVVPYEYHGGYSFAAQAPVFSPNHRWVYCSDMQPSEMLLWKQYDCRDSVKANVRCCFHHAFVDSFHDSWKECPPRHSFDARIFVTFDAPESPSSKL